MKAVVSVSSLPSYAGLDVLQGPLIFHMLPVSVYCTFVNAFQGSQLNISPFSAESLKG